MGANRTLYIDVAKIVAIFLVLVNHTNSEIFLSYSPSVTWFSSLTYFYISRIAVPVFLMATGALLLGRVEGYRRHLQRMWRMFAVLLVFSLFYYNMNPGFPGSLSEAGTVIKSLIEKPASNALWYVYLYLCLLMVMPFLQRLVQALEKRDIEIVIIISLAVMGLSMALGHIFSVNIYGQTDFTLFCYPIGYLFAGYYINRFIVPDRKLLVAAIIVFIACIIFSDLISYQQFSQGFAQYLFWSNLGLLNISLPSIAAFYIFRHIASLPAIQKRSRLIGELSLCVFGIYLTSDFVLVRTHPWYQDLAHFLHIFFACICWQAIIFTLCLVPVFLARRVKWVARYL